MGHAGLISSAAGAGSELDPHGDARICTFKSPGDKVSPAPWHKTIISGERMKDMVNVVAEAPIPHAPPPWRMGSSTAPALGSVLLS